MAVEGVTKRFRGLTAVNAVSLRVEAGGIVAVIGPNGAGKTTLINQLTGVLRPDAVRTLVARFGCEAALYVGDDVTEIRQGEADRRIIRAPAAISPASGHVFKSK